MNCPCGKEVPEPQVDGWKCPKCGRKLSFDEEGWPHFARPYHFEEDSLDEADLRTVAAGARERPRVRRSSCLARLGALLAWSGCVFLVCAGYLVLRSTEGELRVDWHRFSATEWAVAIGLGALAGLVLQACYVFFKLVWRRRRRRR